MARELQLLFNFGDTFVDPVKILWYIVLHPIFNSKWSFLYTLTNIALCFLYVALAIKGILVSDKNDIFFITENIQTCFLMVHIIGNALNLHATRQDLLDLLKQKSKFWKITKFNNKLLGVETLKKTYFMKKSLRSCNTVAIITGILFNLQPFITGSLPTVCYVPDGWFSYLTVTLWYLSLIAYISVVGSPFLFCTLVISLVEQFDLLAYKFKDMCSNSFENIWKELEALVDHHNFLISYSEKLNAAFRNIFLLIFIISVSSASVAVFIFMQPGAWANRIKCGIYFSCVILEIGFYCVPAEITTNTALRLDRILYDSQWYEIDTISFKKCLPLVTSRAQRPMVFNSYGMVNMNLSTYVAICKTVFSFYTYLNSVKKL